MFARKCIKSWFAQGSSGKKVTLLHVHEMTFLHIKGALDYIYGELLSSEQTLIAVNFSNNEKGVIFNFISLVLSSLGLTYNKVSTPE